MKIGLDDFVVANGPEAFQHRLAHPCWVFRPTDEAVEVAGSTHESVWNAVTSMINIDRAERELAIDALKRKTCLRVSALRSFFNVAESRWNQLLGKSAHGKRRIDISSHVPRVDLLNTISKLLKDSKIFFTYGKDLAQITGDHSHEIIDASALPSALSDLGVEFCRNSEKGTSFHFFPDNHARAAHKSKLIRSQLPEVLLITEAPGFDEQMCLLEPGYNASSKVYYCGKAIQPSFERHNLCELTDGFLWKNNASRTNYYALLLTVILRNHFRGDRPFASISGNGQGIGKSIAAKAAALIGGGKIPESFSYTSEEDELDKRFGAVVDKSDFPIVDNAKFSGEIGNSTLERTITDDPFSVRRLGHSKTISRANTLVIQMTVNNAIFGKDLSQRLLPIQLHLPDGLDASKVEYKFENILDWAKEHLYELRSELCGMVIKWVDAGMPKVRTVCRFRGWSSTIGGILQVNGLEDFLGNVDEVAVEYDKDALRLGQLFKCHPNTPIAAADLVDTAKSSRLFPELVNAEKPATVLTNIFSRHLGKRIGTRNGFRAILIDGPFERHDKVKTFIAKTEELNSSNVLTTDDVGSEKPRQCDNELIKPVDKIPEEGWYEDL